VELLERVEG